MSCPLRFIPLVLLTLLLLGGCGEPPAPSTNSPESDTVTVTPPAPSPPEPRTSSRQGYYERSLAFVSVDGDSVLITPWSFRVRRQGGQEIREQDSRMAWAGSWESLALDVDTGAVGGEEWRILPSQRIRILVGSGDALEEVFLRDPYSELSTTVGLPLARWSGPSREVARFHRGTTRLSLGEEDDPVEQDGFLLDLGFSSEEEDRWRDWVFVHAGDFFQGAFLQRSSRQEGEDEGALSTYQGWTRFAVRERRWSDVHLEWSDVRSFEDARRDIPVAWTLRGGEGTMEIDLEAESSHLSTEDAEGAVRPVDAFFQVRGELRMEGDTVPVLGVIRHRQP